MVTERGEVMREILFKAKRKNWKELPEEQWWVEGNLILSNDADDDFEAIIIPQTNSNMFTKHVGFKEVSCDLGFENWYKVDKNTICQYTGLTDKNSNKIWENDILQGHGNPKDLVKIVYGKFYVINIETLEKIDEVIGWHTEVIPTDEISKREPFCLPMPLTDFYIDRSEFEVINNIFDNPELLEVNK